MRREVRLHSWSPQNQYQSMATLSPLAKSADLRHVAPGGPTAQPPPDREGAPAPVAPQPLAGWACGAVLGDAGVCSGLQRPSGQRRPSRSAQHWPPRRLRDPSCPTTRLAHRRWAPAGMSHNESLSCREILELKRTSTAGLLAYHCACACGDVDHPLHRSLRGPPNCNRRTGFLGFKLMSVDAGCAAPANEPAASATEEHCRWHRTCRNVQTDGRPSAFPARGWWSCHGG